MKTAKTPKKIPETPLKKYWKYLAAVLAISVVIIVAAFFLIPWQSPSQEANVLYSKSVDLANAGNYNDALADADQALVLNVTSLNALIQANRAGILVELGRNNDAIAAADAALSYQGNLTPFQQAGALYSKSVDLANAGNYNGALADADQALALNVTSLNALIQANRAGILVELGRNNDAITAADAALSYQGNLTSLQSIAWFNKGNALRNLDMIDEARAAYANATALDPTLKPPAI
jgi:tetratricopeptide (TPR) repeat protein